jgi:hypothetical protein
MSMDPNVSTLERAFELAATGRFLTVSEIKLRLHREGYHHEIIDGPIRAKQLAAAMEQGRAERYFRTQFGRTTMAVNKPTGDNARKGAVTGGFRGSWLHPTGAGQGSSDRGGEAGQPL